MTDSPSMQVTVQVFIFDTHAVYFYEAGSKGTWVPIPLLQRGERYFIPPRTPVKAFEFVNGVLRVAQARARSNLWMTFSMEAEVPNFCQEYIQLTWHDAEVPNFCKEYIQLTWHDVVFGDDGQDWGELIERLHTELRQLSAKAHM